METHLNVYVCILKITLRIGNNKEKQVIRVVLWLQCDQTTIENHGGNYRITTTLNKKETK